MKALRAFLLCCPTALILVACGGEPGSENSNLTSSDAGDAYEVEPSLPVGVDALPTQFTVEGIGERGSANPYGGNDGRCHANGGVLGPSQCSIEVTRDGSTFTFALSRGSGEFYQVHTLTLDETGAALKSTLENFFPGLPNAGIGYQCPQVGVYDAASLVNGKFTVTLYEGNKGADGSAFTASCSGSISFESAATGAAETQ